MSGGSRDRSSEVSPVFSCLWRRFAELRLLFDRSCRMTNAHATRQIQQNPITITPTSTVSLASGESGITIRQT